MTKKKLPLVLTGAIHIDGRFISKVHVAKALTATGTEVLKALPKDNQAQVAVGAMMGKRKTNALLLTAGSRGIEVVNFGDLVTDRLKKELAKTLRASNALCTTEAAWLASRRKKADKQEAA